MKRNILIIPTAKEAEPFLRVFSPCLLLNKFPFQIHLTETVKNKNSWALLICGIGQVRAAAATTFALTNFSAGSEIILTGIAGAVSDHDRYQLKPGDIAVAQSEKYLRFGRFDHHCNYWPGDCNPDIPLRFKMHSPGFFAGLTEFTVPFGCADQITANRDEQNFLKSQHPEIAVENMEGAAFAHVCQLFNKPATEIRAISNYTGQKSREWNWSDSLKSLNLIAEALHEYRQGK